MQTNHTRRLVLHETASHNVGRNSFVGTDRDRSPRTHKIVAYDSFTGHFNQRTGEVRFQLAFAFKGGLIVGRIKGVVEDPFDHAVLGGPILRGTAKFAGIDGSITAILTPVNSATPVTLKYHY